MTRAIYRITDSELSVVAGSHYDIAIFCKWIGTTLCIHCQTTKTRYNRISSSCWFR